MLAPLTRQVIVDDSGRSAAPFRRANADMMHQWEAGRINKRVSRASRPGGIRKDAWNLVSVLTTTEPRTVIRIGHDSMSVMIT